MNRETQIGILKSRGLKATDARLKLLNCFSENGDALSYAQIQGDLRSMDRITLYRTLSILTEKGVIHKAIETSKDTYYAICAHSCSEDGHNHQHIHFKCESCEEVKCIDYNPGYHISIEGYKISNVDIQAQGICSKCA